MVKLTQIFTAKFFHCKIIQNHPKNSPCLFLEETVLNCISGIKNEDDTQFPQINLEENKYMDIKKRNQRKKEAHQRKKK